MQSSDGILSGIRVLELGHFVAAPFCTRLLADLGAEVIKIEPFTGDPVRQWGKKAHGTTAWWSVHARNKRLICVDLKKPRGITLVRQLLARCDALIENFRPGHLDRLGLTEAEITQANPSIVIARISGFGQDGPYKDRAAFGVIGEAMGGLRYLCNHPPGTTDLPPVRTGISAGDSLAGLYAAFGVVSALWRLAKVGPQAGPQTVDVALTESVLSFMEGMLPEFGAFGAVRQPEGSRIPTAAPSSAYPTKDQQWIIIAANSDPLFTNLCRLIGQPGLASDGRFIGNALRVQNAAEIDAIIGAWTIEREAKLLERLLIEANIPSTLIYTAADIAADPQFATRGMVRKVRDPLLGETLHPGVVPHFPAHPGTIRWTGAAPGAHTTEVLGDLLGYSDGQVEDLRIAGVVR